MPPFGKAINPPAKRVFRPLPNTGAEMILFQRKFFVSFLSVFVNTRENPRQPPARHKAEMILFQRKNVVSLKREALPLRVCGREMPGGKPLRGRWWPQDDAKALGVYSYTPGNKKRLRGLTAASERQGAKRPPCRPTPGGSDRASASAPHGTRDTKRSCVFVSLVV